MLKSIEDLKELEALAKAAKRTWNTMNPDAVALARFMGAADPQTVRILVGALKVLAEAAAENGACGADAGGPSVCQEEACDKCPHREPDGDTLLGMALVRAEEGLTANG